MKHASGNIERRSPASVWPLHTNLSGAVCRLASLTSLCFSVELYALTEGAKDGEGRESSRINHHGIEMLAVSVYMLVT